MQSPSLAPWPSLPVQALSKSVPPSPASSTTDITDSQPKCYLYDELHFLHDCPTLAKFKEPLGCLPPYNMPLLLNYKPTNSYVPWTLLKLLEQKRVHLVTIFVLIHCLLTLVLIPHPLLPLTPWTPIQQIF